MTLESKYGFHKDQPDDESYSTLTFSLFTMGDFARYVVEPGVHQFTRHRLGQAVPVPKRGKPRFVKIRWQRFTASLSAKQVDAVISWVNQAGDRSTSGLAFRLREQGEALSDEQTTLLDSVYAYPKVVSDSYPADVACRWIFRRVLSLGWTPQLFGREDRFLRDRRYDRASHKAERWGKKYQWMAYHELLARIADNYQSSLRYDDSGPYEGLHQITGDREIDPSLPPIDYRAFNENNGHGASAWLPSPIRLTEWPPSSIDFSRYQRQTRRFLADTESEPTVAGSMFVRDISGEEWVILDSYVTKSDPQADKGWRGLQEHSTLGTLLVAAGEAKPLLAALGDKGHDELRFQAGSNDHTDCCYVGEIGRVGPACVYRQDNLQPVTIDDRTFNAVATVEKYVWEGSILDCSIGETVTTALPSTFVQRSSTLTFDMRGPCWLDANGTPVLTYYEESGNESRALLARAAFLRSYLATQNLELATFHWFERMYLGDDFDGKHPFVEVNTDAWLTAGLTIHLSKPRRRTRDLPAE